MMQITSVPIITIGYYWYLPHILAQQLRREARATPESRQITAGRLGTAARLHHYTATMADVGSQRGAHPIVVSPELQQVLREYTKAVMRDRPEDVLSYSRDWFIEKTHEQRIGVHQHLSAMELCLNDACQPQCSHVLDPCPPKASYAEGRALWSLLHDELTAGEYELPESNSDKYNALSGELKRKIAVSFKRYDVNCDRAINSLELRQLLRGAGKLFGFENEVWDFPCGSPLA
eukprot:2538152-Pleurochrysis_carterae.AAC.9